MMALNHMVLCEEHVKTFSYARERHVFSAYDIKVYYDAIDVMIGFPDKNSWHAFMDTTAPHKNVTGPFIHVSDWKYV